MANIRKVLLRITAFILSAVMVMGAFTGCADNNNEPEVTLSAISVTTAPFKLTYEAGESFDPAGIEITAAYTDGSEKVVTGYIFSPSLPLTRDITSVTISYTEDGVTMNAFQPVMVKKARLESVQITKAPDKTEYAEGGTFNRNGMVVTAYYKDGSSAAVTEYDVNPTVLVMGTEYVTVSYTEGGITKTATQAVTVTENAEPLLRIEIEQDPDKTAYKEGEVFNPAGMIVKAVYADKTVTVTDYTYIPSGALALSDTRITVSYMDNDVIKTAVVPITVTAPNPAGFSDADMEIVRQEAKLSFRSLYFEANNNRSAPGYGLVYDRYPGSPNLASTASVGFFLAALPGAIDEGWISYDQAKDRAEGTFDTLLSLEHFNGFFYHFLKRDTGVRDGGSEVSVIDTALMIAGALTAGEYFGGTVREKAYQLYDRIDWNFYTYQPGNKVQFRMSFKPEKAVENGKYKYTFTDTSGNKVVAGADAPGVNDGDGFEGAWDWTGEQFVMYVLGAGAVNPAYRIPKRMFYDFNRPYGNYQGGPSFYYSWNGSLFVHQFSHCFIDFRDTKDENNVDWYRNSVNATLAARHFIIQNQSQYLSYGPDSWGLTACDTPSGYSGALGAAPAGKNPSGTNPNIAQMSEGTIAPGGALGSMPFAPELVLDALKHYNTYPLLQSKYGLKDAYNIKNSGAAWYAQDIIGIDKGVTAVMLLNFINGSAWKYFMQSPNIQSGMSVLGITKVAAAA